MIDGARSGLARFLAVGPWVGSLMAWKLKKM
jgi:hypothetical protein